MRLSYPPAASYYAASVASSARLSVEGPRPHRETLRGEHRFDVVVLGGGIAGCSAALHLAQRGYRVALLEARVVGYGASGRSGGQTIFGLAASQARLTAEVGREAARRLFELSIEALDLTQALIGQYGIDCDYHANHVHVAVKPRHLDELQEWARELHEDYHYTSARLLNRDELQQHVRSERYLGGLLDSRSGHLHPLKYTQGVAHAAELAGAEIFENSPVLRYTDGAEVTVYTAHGSVRCAHLVLCGNAYIGAVAPSLARRILGVGTYIIATEKLGENVHIELSHLAYVISLVERVDQRMDIGKQRHGRRVLSLVFARIENLPAGCGRAIERAGKCSGLALIHPYILLKAEPFAIGEEQRLGEQQRRASQHRRIV